MAYQTHKQVAKLDHLLLLLRETLPNEFFKMTRKPRYNGALAIGSQQKIEATTWFLDIEVLCDNYSSGLFEVRKRKSQWDRWETIRECNEDEVIQAIKKLV